MIAELPPHREHLGAGADALALRYQQGDASVLPPLYDALRPVIDQALTEAAGRSRLHGLPGPLQWADMQQQVWPMLAHLAHGWEPSGGAFGAYVRVSLPYEIARYVRLHSHARRSASVQVVSVPHDEADELLKHRAGDDGRRWAESLALAELVLTLPPRQRAVLRLLEVERVSVHRASRYLGIADVTVLNEHRRALQTLRRRYHGEPVPAPLPWADRPPLVRLLRVLLRDRSPSGSLPGRRAVCEAAGVAQHPFNAMMADLAARGVIEGRGKRHPGRLVDVGAVRLLRELDGGV